MSYVNIPESGLHGAIAKIVGKMQGQVMAKVIESSTNITNSLNRKGCPTSQETGRLRRQLSQNDRALKGVASRISKFSSIPSKLKAPLSGLKAALKIILSLPIPQGIGIPPGPAGGLILGLPINVTTKYADTMHLLKEFIKQISELVESITVVLDVPSATLKSLQRNISAADAAVKCCEVEHALKSQVENGNIKFGDLEDAGLVDDGDLIFSNLGPRLLASVSNSGLTNSTKDSLKNKGDQNYKGKWIAGMCYQENDKVTHKGVKYIYICDNPTTIGPDGKKICEKPSTEENQPPSECWLSLEESTSSANKTLLEGLKKLNDSNIDKDTKTIIKDFIDTFKDVEEQDRLDDSKFYHTGPDGTVYRLEIKNDPNSPEIAPRRFAVAIDPSGVAVLSGEKSFSSSIDVLLDEIKFRIDNQLP